MAMLVVTLQEHHGARFQDGEFDHMAKDCFYAGLWQEHKALVVHLKDQDQMEPVEMLKALWEIEESRCLASTSTKLAQPKTMDRYGYNSHHNLRKKNDWYIARLATVDQLDQPAREKEPLVEDPDAKLEAKYDDGYYCGVSNTTDTMDHAFNHCYNFM